MDNSQDLTERLSVRDMLRAHRNWYGNGHASPMAAVKAHVLEALDAD